MRQCDVNDVPDSLLEGGTTASLIALRLSEARPTRSTTPRSWPQLLPEILIETRRWLLLSSKRSPPPWTLYHHIRASRTSWSMRRTRTPHWSPTRRQGGARGLCKALYPSFSRGRHGTCLGLRRGLSHRRGRFRGNGGLRGAGALFMCRARRRQNAAGFWMIWRRSARRAWPQMCGLGAGRLPAYLTSSKDEATARHASKPLANGSADDCLEAALRVLSKEESIPFLSARG